MKKNIKSILAVLMAAAAILGALTVSGCNKRYKVTKDDNPLFAFEEVKEINETLQMPFILGESEENVVSKGFESYGSSIEHHIMRYRSINNKDVTYTLGTREMYYGEPDPNTELFVTGFHIYPENKEIVKNDDGTRTPVYTTSRSVLGIKLGDLIDDAKKTLLRHGYESLFEQEKSTGLPMSREFTFRKGVVMFSMSVESTDDISQISVWIPYDEGEIGSINSQSKLPADLGLIYSVMQNKAFSYAGKNTTSRKYETEDGCIAIMRGFPDVVDMYMTAEVSFTSNEYNVLGVYPGMSTDEAGKKLIEAGCSEDEEGVFVFNSIAAVQLYSENGVVTRIAATLKKTTNLLNLELEQGKQ